MEIKRMALNTDPDMNEFCEICKKPILLNEEYQVYTFDYFVHRDCIEQKEYDDEIEEIENNKVRDNLYYANLGVREK
jgi:hypothetical protein